MSAADHLEVPRGHGLFKHHGIDLGDGTVAHYLEGREILRSSLEKFCAGKNFKVVIHANASPNALTLQRAMSRIGEQSYNLLFNNCEHFANWCKTGRHRSNQMEKLLKTSSLGVIAIGQLMPAALFTGLDLLLSKGLSNESSRHQAKEGIKNLEKLRKNLLLRLDANLKEIENWLNNQPRAQRTQSLILRGQALADQLNTIEKIESQITKLLNKEITEN